MVSPSKAKEEEKGEQEEEQSEEQEGGAVGIQDFKNLFSFSVGNCGFFLYFFFCFAAAFCQLYTTYWISFWTSQDFEEQQKSIYPTLFGVLIIVYCILVFIRAVVIFTIFIVSTSKMHNVMVEKVIRSKILFFDSNPIGRIFTRFSKDMSVLDLIMPGITVFATFGIFRTITVVMTLSYLYPYLLVIVGIASFLMLLILKRALGPLRES